MNRLERAYWIWLQHAFGPGSPKPAYIGKRHKSIEAFYKEGPRFWAQYAFISDRELSALKSFTPRQAEAQLEYAEKVDQQVLAWCDEEYPAPLRQLEDPPAVLYVKGTLPDFAEALAIAVIGSRKAGPGAVKTAELMSYELSKAGAVIVSGGARGIDAAAHRGAMRGTAPTVCVLACGIDYPYLMENQMLRGRIVEKGGALITEYPPGTAVNKGVFAVRNRIMSGLGKGLLVVCSEARSGTMLTVDHAIRQNRDIFAVPGAVDDPFAMGTNRLIRDGAKPTLSAADILEEYEGRYTKALPFASPGMAAPEEGLCLKPAVQEKASAPDMLSANARGVLRALKEEPVHLSELMAQTGLRASQVQSAATELELLGRLQSYSGQRYGLKPKQKA